MASALAVSRDPKRAEFLWCCFAALIIANAALLALAFVSAMHASAEDKPDVWVPICWVGTATFLFEVEHNLNAYRWPSLRLGWDVPVWRHQVAANAGLAAFFRIAIRMVHESRA